jgi:hypothetical protein
MKSLTVEVVYNPTFEIPISIIYGTSCYAGNRCWVRARRCVVHYANEFALTWHDSMPVWRKIEGMGGALIKLYIDGEGSIVTEGGVLTGDFLAPSTPPYFPVSSGFDAAILY